MDKGWLDRYKEREELRHNLLHEDGAPIERVNVKLKEDEVITKDKEEYMKPIEYVNCPSFVMCEFDYKCRAYNPAYQECVSCVLHEVNGICHKDSIHTMRNMEMMINKKKVSFNEGP